MTIDRGWPTNRDVFSLNWRIEGIYFGESEGNSGFLDCWTERCEADVSHRKWELRQRKGNIIQYHPRDNGSGHLSKTGNNGETQ